jgi:hypothetical protein
VKSESGRKRPARVTPRSSQLPSKRPRERAGVDSRGRAEPKSPAGPVPRRSVASVIPWTNILGDGERPLGERTHRDGQGLVVLLGPLDTLILDLPEQLEALPEHPVAPPKPLVTLPVEPGANRAR